MKSDAYAVSRMKPRYHARKKIVHGITNLRRRWTSSWNSGDRSIASQSIAGWARSNGSAMTSLLLRQGSAVVLPGARTDFVPDRSRVVRFDERRLRYDERRPLGRACAYARPQVGLLVTLQLKDRSPAPPGKDADPKESLWDFEGRGRRMAVIGARQIVRGVAEGSTISLRPRSVRRR